MFRVSFPVLGKGVLSRTAGMLAALAASGLCAGDALELPEVSRYAQEILDATRAEKESGGLHIEAAVAPDAFAYRMARGLEELRNAGYSGETLETKVKQLAAKLRRSRGKALIVLEIQPRKTTTHFFMTSSLKRHLTIATDEKKFTYSVVSMEPRLRPRVWNVFEYPPDRPRRVTKKKLVHLKPVRLELESSTLKPGEEPFRITLQGLIRVEQTGGVVGVNPDIYQIGCFEWSRLAMQPIEVLFRPGRWRLPPPPEGFDAFLEKLVRRR